MVDRICYVARRRGEQQGAMCTFFGRARVGHIRTRMAMQMHRGHQTFFWPQSYFTPFCDMILRFESLKRDFDGLMAKIGCPLRLPEQRKKARGNRLLPLLADDVVASVRRMYADDYALVKRLAGLDLDELLANATSA